METKNGLKKLAIGLVLSVFVVACGSQVLARPPAGLKIQIIGPRTYIVKKGDTLSGIAKHYFGDYKVWKKLAEINNLKVETINGIDYVWLKIGQKICFSQNAMDRGEAKVILQAMIEKRVNLFRKPIYDSSLDIYWIMQEYTKFISERLWAYTEDYKKGVAIRNTMMKLDRLMHDFDANRIKETFVPAMSSVLTTANGDELLEFGLWMMALLEQESGYRNVPGQDGELGWYQVKSDTWKEYSKVLYGIDVDASQSIMEKSFWIATRWETSFLEYLLKKNNGSWQHTMQNYNRGSNKVIYSQQVYQKYRNLRRISKTVR